MDSITIVSGMEHDAIAMVGGAIVSSFILDVYPDVIESIIDWIDGDVTDALGSAIVGNCAALICGGGINFCRVHLWRWDGGWLRRGCYFLIRSGWVWWTRMFEVVLHNTLTNVLLVDEFWTTEAALIGVAGVVHGLQLLVELFLCEATNCATIRTILMVRWRSSICGGG